MKILPLPLLLAACLAVALCVANAGANFALKAADVCDGRRRLVFGADKPLLAFDDKLPASAAACNLSILVPIGAANYGREAVYGRLRYLAVRLFRPTAGRLDELRRHGGICLEAAFTLRRAAPAEASSEEAAAAAAAPPLRERRTCVSPEAADADWLFEDLQRPNVSTGSRNETSDGGLVAEFSWRLVNGPGGVGARADRPLQLSFIVAPFFNCSGSIFHNDGSFVHCQKAAGGLCVSRSLACSQPAVSYIECPKRIMFSSSVLHCAMYNADIGFYLFLVVAGSLVVGLILLYLLFRPLVDIFRARQKAVS